MCKNYYQMDKKEIGESIIAISEWLQCHHGYPEENNVKFAAKVAWNAYDIKEEEDPFVELIINEIA